MLYLPLCGHSSVSAYCTSDVFNLPLMTRCSFLGSLFGQVSYLLLAGTNVITG